ncbi:glycoside hydrolase family 108 protein [Shewanella sp.]|uniref:glycoside hydrolase family 108 protein n=1 Tax=Shewanella sp. TaxID=50422 RepID=UPI003A971D8C
MQVSELKAGLIDALIIREGGYSNRKNDRGGATRYGITEATARRHGYEGDMANLPYDLAVDIYASEFWQSLKLDSIGDISQPLAVQLFDFGVNSAPKNAATQLQLLLNVLNDEQRLYADLTVDGILGSKTIAALTAYQRARGNDGMTILTEALRALRISFCVDIAINDASQEENIFGWLSRIVHLN